MEAVYKLKHLIIEIEIRFSEYLTVSHDYDVPEKSKYSGDSL